MRKLVARIGEWLKWRRVELAERMVWGLGYGVYHRMYVEEAATQAGALVRYAARSGHLTRRFKAGKRVQESAAHMADLLYCARILARSPARGGPTPIAPVIVGALAGLLVGVLTRGGARSW